MFFFCNLTSSGFDVNIINKINANNEITKTINFTIIFVETVVANI